MIQPKAIQSFVVHPVGIGTWLMGSGLYPDKITHYAVYGNEQAEIEAIRYALKVGQNHIDTAQIYGVGHTEEIVGAAIKDHQRSSLFLASKLWKSHIKKDSVVPAIEGMLERLQTSYLDLVYIHAWWEEYEPIIATLGGLNAAVDKGLIRGIGVSNFSLEQLQKAQSSSKHPIVAIQNYYSLANRAKTSPELLKYCREQKIAFVTAKPLERGMLLERQWLKILQPLAEKYNKTPAQIALAWLVNQENVHVIPKASTIEHITLNAESVFELSSEDQSLLNQINTV